MPCLSPQHRIPLPPDPTIVLWLTHRTVPCWDCTEAQTAMLATSLPQATIRHCRNRQEFLRVLPEADVALVWTFEQAWFAQAPRLRWIATPAAGQDFFQVSPPADCRITYGAFHGELMAETVLAMILAECRGVVRAARSSAPWARETLAATMRPLRNAHLAIVGYGHIGRWIGRLARPFGARMTGFRRRSLSRPDEADTGVRLLLIDDLDATLPSVDHLVLALPGGPGTDHLLDARRLALLPPRAVIYNVGRGNAIDETALAEALTADRLAGAYLDVFAQEPLSPDSRLRACPNLLIMPHASAIAPNYLELFFRELVAEFGDVTDRSGGTHP